MGPKLSVWVQPGQFFSVWPGLIFAGFPQLPQLAGVQLPLAREPHFCVQTRLFFLSGRPLSDAGRLAPASSALILTGLSCPLEQDFVAFLPLSRQRATLLSLA